MDDLSRLQAFRAGPVAVTAARAQAAFALDEAIGARRRRPLRPSVIAAGCVIAAVLATGAYALYQKVIVGSPAPVSVKNAERSLNEVKNELIPVVHNHHPDIEIAKTKAAAVINTSAGPVYLWVAPDTRGLDCSWLQITADDLPGGRPNLSGGCTVGGTGVYVGIGLDDKLGLVCCYVGTPGAKTIKVRFADGTSLTVPVYDKHVLAQTNPNGAIAELVVRGANGHILVEHRYPHPLTPAQRLHQMLLHNHPSRTGPWRTIITLRTIGTDRLVRERVATGWQGNICYDVRLPTGTAGACMPPPKPTVDDVRPTQIGGPPTGVFLYGPVGADTRTLELEFEDGTHVPVGIHHGYVLYQINPRNYPSGHRPTRLIARDANGRIINNLELDFLP